MGRRIALGALFAVVGLVPAFFLVFATIFSDPGPPREYVMALGLIALSYGLLGLLAGYVMRVCQAGLWLSAPAGAIVVLYSLKESGRLPLHLAVVVVTVVGACAGAYWGVALSKTRRGQSGK